MKGRQQLLEEGDPEVDPRLFRRCLGQYGTGVAVITTRTAEHNAGLTVNSVASVSLQPPLVLWSVSRASRSFSKFENAENFAVNILSKDQIELSRQFSSDVPDRFSGVATTPGNADAPLIDGAVVQIECSREAAHDAGDHVIVVGRVVRLKRYAGDPLLFVQGRYAVAADHPGDEVDLEETSPAAPTRSSDSGPLIPLIFETHHALSEKFEDHRRAEGMSSSVARALAVIYDHPGISLEDLSRHAYLGVRITEDVLDEMSAQGDVTRSDGGWVLTESGKEKREAIRRRWLEFQQNELAALSSSQVEQASSALAALLARQKQ